MFDTEIGNNVFPNHFLDVMKLWIDFNTKI